MTHSIFSRAAALEAAGQPFVVAIVVAVARPTSARPGASGIVHPDGTIEGWVGAINALRWMSDGEVDAYVGPGPLITDDRPLPEYFLLRRLLNPDAQ